MVLHCSTSYVSVLAEILSRSGPLPAVEASDGEQIRRGRIYVARSDHHLLLEPGHLHVIHGPKENHFRPAIDPLFRSAALVYGPRVIGVVLTGMLDDGSAGLYDIRRRGGTAVIQDPGDADFPSMPLNALRHVKTPYCVPLREIAPLLATLVRQPAQSEKGFPVPEGMRLENKIAAMEANTVETLNKVGAPAGYACPECYGPLWRLDGVDLPRFRCHTGHAYSPESLLEAQAGYAEDGLWRVLQSADERIALMREMARRARADDVDRSASRWEEQIEKLERLSDFVRKALTSGAGRSPVKIEPNGAPPGKTRSRGNGRKSGPRHAGSRGSPGSKV